MGIPGIRNSNKTASRSALYGLTLPLVSCFSAAPCPDADTNEVDNALAADENALDDDNDNDEDDSADNGDDDDYDNN